MGALSGYIGGPEANQNYAQKAIRAIKTDLKSTLSNAVWSSSIRFAADSVISDGFMAWCSLKDFFPNTPSWKPCEEEDEIE